MSIYAGLLLAAVYCYTSASAFAVQAAVGAMLRLSRAAQCHWQGLAWHEALPWWPCIMMMRQTVWWSCMRQLSQFAHALSVLCMLQLVLLFCQ